MKKILHVIVIITSAFTSVRSHVAHWNNPNQLHPVHGIYVKPSIDGTTGDLYVAATEENGVKSQWLTDQPIGFLPVSAATQPHQTAAIPISFTPSYPREESITQKRAVVSPPVQYAYALPVPSTASEGTITSYPYGAVNPTSSSSAEGSTSQCLVDPAKANIPQYSPFQFFYPQMMSAYANAMGVLKDAGLSDDTASSVMSQTSPMWSPYAYPMYVMMDPNTWAQSQAASSTSTTSTSANDEA